MAKFFNKDMGELAHQLTISPRRLRMSQIRGMERLLAIIDPNRAYPFDFVCYHITKYRKRAKSAGSAIPGQALISDLVTMAEVCSRGASIPVSELGEPYRTHQQLAEDLKVSTKTIRRWRNRGLLGMRVVFEDGVNRLAFLQATIDRFVANNRELVERGASFRQLTQAEREEIVLVARELLSRESLKLHAVAKRVAEQSGRAVETVRYTLRRYDASCGSDPLFTRQGEPVRCEREESIWRCKQSGESVASIAGAFDCTTEEIEQVLRRVQVQQWRHAPLTYVDNELFDAPNADEFILDAPEPTCDQPPKPRIPKDLPTYLKSLYLVPLLTREQEHDLFRRYNYLKFKARRLIDATETDDISVTAFFDIKALMERIDSLKQRIIQANLRLVVSIAKKHVGWTRNFFETVSDGNISLMRAVENFDCARGTKFSTYASWAVMKNYARSIPEEYYRQARCVTGQEALLEQAADHRAAPASPSDRLRVRELIDDGLNELNEREREIVRGHFGLVGDDGPQTLEQIGKRFGVTKERIRQIEQRALARLREVLAPSLIDALTA